MNCPRCGSGNPEGKNFCGDCSAPLPQRCANCGAGNPTGKKFCGDCGAALTGVGTRTLSTTSPLSSSQPISKQPSLAERRPLTVMFCDLADSTAISTQVDPEDFGEFVNGYHRCCAEHASRYGGNVAKYMGDGILIYFGYPEAHEDDAARAIHAALAILHGVRALLTVAGLKPQVRLGIATGLVIVGDLNGEGAAQERTVVGETPNLAARLQSLAEPGTVVIDATTHSLSGRLFDYRNLGDVVLKGFTEPVSAWQVLRASLVESRFEALHEGKLTSLFGREEEVELLLRRWHQVKNGSGRVVLLSGEPGIGKSRLSDVLHAHLLVEPHVRLQYFCSPYHADSALFPIIGQLERAAGFDRNDAAVEKLAKLEALLAPEATPGCEDVMLLAELISLPTNSCYTPLQLSPRRKRDKTFDVLLRQLEELARRRPILMIFEDAHWIDPSSRELLDQFVERVPRLPVLLIVTFRPEFRQSWSDQPHVTALSLNRLDRRLGTALVQELAGKKPLPPDLVEQIVHRTDGVPLFVEELTKVAIEADRGMSAGVIAADPLLRMAIPVTLHASLMARLDRIGPNAKEVAQIGAAIGREFSYSLLAMISQRTDRELQASLRQLTETGLLFSRGTPPDAHFHFKHALIQDAAYGMLLRGKRQTLHARIGAVLKQHFPELVEQQPELLALHYTQAALIEKAIGAWNKAGRQSASRSAMVEAVSQLRKGLDLVAGLSDSSERWQKELELQSALAGALAASRGVGNIEAWHALARARDLCEQLDERPSLVPILAGQVNWLLHRCEHVAALSVANDSLRLAVQCPERTEERLFAHRHIGYGFFLIGEFDASMTHLREALALPPEIDVSLVSLIGFDPRTSALTLLALDLFAAGYPEQSALRAADAIAWSRKLRHPYSLVLSLHVAAIVGLLCGAERAADPYIEEMVSVTTEQQFPHWLAVANIMSGYILSTLNRRAEGLALALKGLADQTAAGSNAWQTFYRSLLARAYERGGQIDEAFGALREAQVIVDRGERWFQAELHRLEGDWIYAHQPEKRVKAEACLQRALSVAQSQNAKMWELRAATSLARLWRGQGRPCEARDLLRPVTAWFSEGLEMPDFIDAKLLLEELR